MRTGKGIGDDGIERVAFRRGGTGFGMFCVAEGATALLLRDIGASASPNSCCRVSEGLFFARAAKEM